MTFGVVIIHFSVSSERKKRRNVAAQQFDPKTLIPIVLGIGCGSVGRTVTSNTSDLRFASSHQQISFTIDYIKNCSEKTKIKKERPGMAYFKKNFNSICAGRPWPDPIQKFVSILIG